MLGHDISRLGAMFSTNGSSALGAESSTGSPPPAPSLSLAADPQYVAGARSGPLPIFTPSTEATDSRSSDSEPWLDNSSRIRLVRRMSDPSATRIPALAPAQASAGGSSRTGNKRKFQEFIGEQTIPTPRRLLRVGLKAGDLFNLDDPFASAYDEVVVTGTPNDPLHPSTRHSGPQAHVSRYPSFRRAVINSAALGELTGLRVSTITRRSAIPPRQHAQSIYVSLDHEMYSTFIFHLTQLDEVDQSGIRLKRTLQYLPVVPRKQPPPTSDLPLIILPSHHERVNAAVKPSVSHTWSPGKIPTDLFRMIVEDLAREDIKNMRLVSRDFESKVSASLFHTSVVPFNTELYDMMDCDVKQGPHSTLQYKIKTYDGKGKQKALDGEAYVPAPPSDASEQLATVPAWQNAAEDKDGKVYLGHGLRVFQGFGHHMRRFGMSFEVSETQLAQPKDKKDFSFQESYHGKYPWPPNFYARFDGAAALETTADEHNRMVAAFANLTDVKELALTVDSGLGWLAGPDVSVHGQLFNKDSAVFGSRWLDSSATLLEQQTFWAAYVDLCAIKYPQRDPKETVLVYLPSKTSKEELEAHNKIVATSEKAPCWQHLHMNMLHPAIQHKLATCTHSTALLFPSTEVTNGEESDTDFFPNNLHKSQKEWLLEMEWAQRAFLDTYMLAVIGNQHIFAKNVTKLNISKLSSGLVSVFGRAEFWESLPNLTELIFHVKPDWRAVLKDAVGSAQVPYRHPSNAVNVFTKMAAFIAKLESIKTLSIGWIGGGEHGQGVLARNRHVLPAPVTYRDESLDEECTDVVVFDHVSHLTLVNCWFTPTTLEYLVDAHTQASLTTLVLESVSLAAPPSDVVGPTIAAVIERVQNNSSRPSSSDGYDDGRSARAGNGNPQPVFVNINQTFNIGNPAFSTSMIAPQNHTANIHPGLQTVTAPTNSNNHMPINIPPPPPVNVPPPPPPPAAYTHWSEGHRAGSWATVLDSISPGPRFTDYLPTPQPWEAPLTERSPTNLVKLELKSCGYVKLLNLESLSLDYQHDWTYSTGVQFRTAWFKRRHEALKSFMQVNHDLYTGQITQHMRQRELNALRLAWGLREGWTDQEKAEEGTYDGYYRGGTGRVSGVIEKEMGLIHLRT